MSEQIVQQLGFDASQALAELSKLNKSLASLDRQLGSTAQGLVAFNRIAASNNFAQLAGGLNSVQSAAASIPRHFATLGQSAQQNLTQANQHTRSLVISWETLTRVVATQAIVRALSTIRNEFRETFSSAVEFGNKVAEISTISGNFGSTDIAAQVRKVSDSFNLPLIDSANALYETFSNQVGNTAQSLQFYETAAKFAKGSSSSLADSVNLLSSAISSFQLSADQTGDVAGKFFKAIELGRFTASDLANTLGTVAPQAAQVGISLDEMLAALVAITNAGVKPREALTQFRGIIGALVKPTDDMTKQLREMGFGSALAAVETEGLGEVLSKLSASTQGSNEEFAKHFPNVRGAAGAVIAGARNNEFYAESFREIQAAGKELNDQKFEIVNSSDAQRATKELNRIHNALTVDLGESLTKATAGAFSFVGGAESVVAVSKAAGPAILGVGAALSVYIAQSRIATLQTGLLGTAIGGVGKAAAILGIGISAGLLIGGQIDKQLSANIKALEDSNKQALDDFTSGEGKRLRVAQETDQERVQSALKSSQQFAKAYTKAMDEVAVADKRLGEGIEKSLSRITTARERFADGIGKAAEQAREFAKDSQGRQFDLLTRADDRNFNRTLPGLNPQQQTSRLISRSQELSQKASQDLIKAAKSGDQTAIERALKQFSRAESAGEQAQSIASRSRNRTLEFQAAKNLNTITRQQLVAEQALSEIQQRRSELLREQQERQREIVDEVRGAAKTVVENSNTFDKDGKPLSEAELQKQAQRRKAALKKIADSALSSEDLSLSDALGLGKLVSELGNDLTKNPIKIEFDVENSIRKLQAQLESEFANFRLKTPFLDDLEKVTGKKLKSPDQVSSALSDATSEADKLRRGFSDNSSGAKRIQQLRAEIKQINADSGGVGRNLLRHPANPFDAGLERTDKIRAFREEIAAVATSSTVTDEQLQRLKATLSELNSAGDGFFGSPGARVDTDQFGQAILKLKEMQGLQKQRAESPASAEGAEERLKSLDSLIQGLNPAAPFTAIAPAIEPAVSRASQLADQLERAQRAAASTKIPQGEGQQAALGGLIHPRYFAQGGPVGSDRVPAWLSPGEMVMNRGATSRFYSQLSAMNASPNRTPPAASQVGDTTFNVGDINVNGGPTNDATGRTIVNTLRRAFRREVVKRF